jgi:hypothetical protein
MNLFVSPSLVRKIRKDSVDVLSGRSQEIYNLESRLSFSWGHEHIHTLDDPAIDSVQVPDMGRRVWRLTGYVHMQDLEQLVHRFQQCFGIVIHYEDLP